MHGDRLVTLDQLGEVAAQVWERVPRGGVVWLVGDLGSGKTTFAQEVLRVAGGSPARSPTYALVHHYSTPEGGVIHVDCYRLRSSDEAADLDLHHLGKSARLMLVEWPERGGQYVPGPDLRLRFSHTGEGETRRVEVGSG
jgi:tRNA threonylcarbamoyladenosine biosynthesis protein TsaE